MIKYCPNCNNEIDHLKYNANFNERTYGRSWGVCDLDGDNPECQDSETSEVDDEHEYDFEYECPECGDCLDLSELLDKPEEEESEVEDTADNFNLINKIL